MLAARRGEVPMEDFLAELRTAEVFLPIGDDAPEGTAQGGEGGLSLPIVTGRDGREYTPVFTARERLERFYGAGRRHATVPFSGLPERWPDDVFALLDPGEEVELALPPGDVRRLGERTRRRTGPVSVPAGGKVFVGEPAHEPTEAMSAIAEFAAGMPGVRAAYRAQVLLDRPGEEPHPVIGLLLDDDADREAILRAAAAAIDQVDAGTVDLVEVVEGSTDPIGGWMLAQSAPFYVRPE